MPNNVVSEQMVPMVRKMVGAEWFPKKTSAAHIIGLIIARVPDEEATELRKFMTTLGNDDTTIVRKAVLNNLSKVIHATKNLTSMTEDIFPVLSKLASDPQDAVRLLSVAPLVAFGEALKESPEHTVNLVHPLFVALAADRSWRIRYMLAKHYSQLVIILHDEHDLHPIKTFSALLKDAEPEVRAAAAGELVQVAKVISPENVRTYLIPSLPIIVTDPSAPVKAALASTLNDLSPVVGPNT